MKIFLSVTAITVAILAAPATAHHSFNTIYDITRTLEIEGTVKTFRLINPHSEMTVEVAEPGGEVSTWVIIARTGAGNARREGWRVEDFIGRRVKVEGNPSRREGNTAMAAGLVTFVEDGRTVCFGGCPGGPPIE